MLKKFENVCLYQTQDYKVTHNIHQKKNLLKTCLENFIDKCYKKFLNNTCLVEENVSTVKKAFAFSNFKPKSQEC